MITGRKKLMIKILVIEDEELIRNLICDLLSIKDFKVIEAEDGLQGIKLANAELPDLIICDILMPELDGYNVLKQLQSQPSTSVIPFIFLTAKGTKEDFRQGMNLGADDYLTKPFTEEELLGAVTTRLRKHSSLVESYTNQLQKVESELDYLLYNDPLTNLPNQLSLREIFTQLLSNSRSQNIENGVNLWANKKQDRQIIPILTIGLDRFNRINESLGYTFGDLLLKAVAKRLTNCVLAEDIVARLNSDEFTLILTSVNNKQTIIELAKTILQNLAKSFQLSHQEVFITASIGITFYPENGRDLEKLIAHAKKAMNHAKYKGGNQYQFYTVSSRVEVAEKMVLERDLHHALEREELEIYYQPQVNLTTGKIIGAEALLRWQHREIGFISPAKFIPLAEETGLIEQIGKWVLVNACQQIKSWQNSGLGKLRIAVNLSGSQFIQQNLDQELLHILSNTAIDPKYLELELTESILIENIERSMSELNALKSTGIKIAIDDFGTGYSSLSYLQKFHFDVLKIDRCFIHNIDKNMKNSAITTAIISMAHQLNLKVIAEGVETYQELAFLLRYNCDAMQGYFFSKPLKNAEFESLVKSGKFLNI